MILQILFLSVAWLALTGEVTPYSIMEAVILGLFATLFFAPRSSRSFNLPLRKIVPAISLGLFFLWELVLANLRVAAVVIRGRECLKPAIVDVPLSLQSEAGMALLANLVTLTPGTLSVDVSTESGILYVHALDGEHPEDLRQEIQDGFERRVARLFS